MEAPRTPATCPGSISTFAAQTIAGKRGLIGILNCIRADVRLYPGAFRVPIRLFTVKKPASYLPEAPIGGGLTTTLEIPDSVEICFSMAAAQETHFGELISSRKFSGATKSPLAVSPHELTPRQGRRTDLGSRIVNRETELPITQSAQSVLFLAGRRDLLLSSHPL